MVQHFCYSHHGIYIGNGQVVHYSGFAHLFKKHPIEITSVKTFAQGKNIRIRHYHEPIYKDFQVVHRIKSRMHENRYDLIINNCEHLCTWAITGVQSSPQVVKMMHRLTTLGYASSVLSFMNSLWLALTTTCFALLLYIRKKLKQKSKIDRDLSLDKKRDQQ